MFNLYRKVTNFNPQILNGYAVTLRTLTTSSQLRGVEKPVDKGNKAVKTSPSFAQNIFRGQLETSQLFPFPVALNKEQLNDVHKVIDSMRDAVKNLHDPTKCDREGAFDPKFSDKLWELGVFGVYIPKKYSGLGFNNTQFGMIIEESGYHDLALTVHIGAHQSIGYKALLFYGTEEQKAKYLPQVSSGKVITAFALAEPSGGSDIATIRTKAVKSDDGKYYILNGDKSYIANGSTAGLMTVLTQLEVVNEQGAKEYKPTAFLVERNFGGVTSSAPDNKMGVKASNLSSIHFRDCKVPAENLIGNEGDGFKIAVNILNQGRFGLSMSMGGIIQKCIQRCTDHVTQRVAFGTTLDNLGAIQEKIAKFSMLHYVSTSIGYMLSSTMDLGSKDYSVEAAITKVFTTDSGWYVCDEALQIFGGAGYLVDAQFEKFLRDMRTFKIVDGTNDVLRIFIALTGLQYAGNHLKAGSLPNTDGDMAEHVDASLQSSAKLCNECISMFGETATSLLMQHGKKIVGQQFHLNRIADAAIDIYTMAAVLSRATRSMKLKLPSADHERIMAEAWCVEAANRAQNNFKMADSDDFNENFKRMAKISRNVCKAHDVIQKNPLDYE